jgi:hypothetical protein
MHTLIYGIKYATYFTNTKKNVVEMFKPWPILWRSIYNYLNKKKLVSYIFFILFHLSWTCFQFHYTSFKKSTFTTNVNDFQFFSLNDLQLYS